MPNKRAHSRRGRPTEIENGQYIGFVLDARSLRQIDDMALRAGVERSKIVRKLVHTALKETPDAHA
jgi:hypothetical protein